jgi:hypothetical protein
MELDHNTVCHLLAAYYHEALPSNFMKACQEHIGEDGRSSCGNCAYDLQQYAWGFEAALRWAKQAEAAAETW